MQKQAKSSEVNSQNLPELILKVSALNSKTLWVSGRVLVPKVTLTEELIKSLAFARRCGTLRGGLENIEVFLQTEENGLCVYEPQKNHKEDKARKHASAVTKGKFSRLLLVSNDGSERFYRHCEAILLKYSGRLMGLLVDSSSVELGGHFFGKEKAVKALLVARKEMVAKVLSSIVE